MTADTITAVGQALSQFLRGFQDCFRYRPGFENFLKYCRALAAELPRKNVESIALESGAGVRALQVFLSEGRWDHERLQDRMQQRVAQKHQPAPGAPGHGHQLVMGHIDETSDAKKGDKTPGTQRQYLGCQGKVDNGIVTVHLSVQVGSFKSIVASDLYLPRSWTEDPDRCREAGVPEDIGHRTKPEIALEQHARALRNGVRFDFLGFDEAYGRSVPFLRTLDDRGQLYAGEIPKDFHCFGRRPKYGSLRGEFGTKEVRNLCRYSPLFRKKKWHRFKLQRETTEAQEWMVRRGRVRLKDETGGPTDRAYWLLHAWNPRTGEEKYFISNAPAKTSLRTLMEAAFSRWNVEHSFRVVKSKIGFDQYEGRHYYGLLRHMILCSLVMMFSAEQRVKHGDFFPWPQH